MAVEFKDYYKILGVSSNASEDEIKRAYRKLAREHHPDLNKAAGSETKFKDINEAYEVLRDFQKRKKYDQLNSLFQQGGQFKSSPDWESDVQFNSQSQNGPKSYFWSSDDGDYNSFFETLFDTPLHDGVQNKRSQNPFSSQQRGIDHEANLLVSLEEAFTGTTKSITLHAEDSKSKSKIKNKRYDVRIPAGILPGQKIRLQGQGGQGQGGSKSGDLYLRIEIKPHFRFKLDGRDLITELAITPWEAALGTQIDVPILSGSVTLSIPSGTQSGQKLRLIGKGMPNPKGYPGDLYIVMQIKIPKTLSQKEKALFEELSKISHYNPRE